MSIRLRPFTEADFATLISWVPTAEALAQWCAGFFTFPLDAAQLDRYLESAKQPYAREIFAAETPAREAVGHVELSMIWPHLSCRLSRVLVAPGRRGRGIGPQMVELAVSHAFRSRHVARIDLGVSDDNAVAIACYERQGFVHVGTWRDAVEADGRRIHVHWMTLTRAAWLGRNGAPDR